MKKDENTGYENNIEAVLEKALNKIGSTEEKDVCHYLPHAGGYMHHFTLRRMKQKQPQELSSMIEKFILFPDNLNRVPPRKRAARGSRKRADQFTFTLPQVERMLGLARLAGDEEMMAFLTPKKSLADAKRELIASIQQNRVDQETWNTYVEMLNVQRNAGSGRDPSVVR